MGKAALVFEEYFYAREIVSSPVLKNCVWVLANLPMAIGRYASSWNHVDMI